MKKIKLYIAISLDGKIARMDQSVDWLDTIPNPQKTDYGYFAFYDTIDTTLMGNKTYEHVLTLAENFPYPDKKNYVFTNQQDVENTEYVEFVKSNHINFLKELKRAKGKDIWLIGGGIMNTTLWNEDLIDEMYIHIMPIIIGEGIPMFANDSIEKQLTLVHTKSYESGVVELVYKK